MPKYLFPRNSIQIIETALNKNGSAKILKFSLTFLTYSFQQLQAMFSLNQLSQKCVQKVQLRNASKSRRREGLILSHARTKLQLKQNELLLLFIVKPPVLSLMMFFSHNIMNKFTKCYEKRLRNQLRMQIVCSQRSVKLQYARNPCNSQQPYQMN